ncbi:MAG: GNAT family N-acetyltransferase [Bacteroidales bacterium]|jgi:predicted GNAT family N-acyltransferase|nr:GNAT family N-acetyltransferase [Bacteroidales bacterium]
MKEDDEILIEHISMNDKQKMMQAKEIRIDVFVKEQDVDIDADWDDKQSENYLAYYNNKVVGTIRWREIGRCVKMERLSVEKKYRGKGIASMMIDNVLLDIRQKTQKKIILHAQLLAMPLYERKGFKKKGKLFYEQNIAHYSMFKD